MPPLFRLDWTGGSAALADGDHVLGRDPALELFFDSTTVSRRHARIRVAGMQATIEDLGSKNGTFIGDQRIASVTPIVAGDTIRIGSISVMLRAVQALGSTETTLRPLRHP